MFRRPFVCGKPPLPAYRTWSDAFLILWRAQSPVCNRRTRICVLLEGEVLTHLTSTSVFWAAHFGSVSSARCNFSLMRTELSTQRRLYTQRTSYALPDSCHFSMLLLSTFCLIYGSPYLFLIHASHSLSDTLLVWYQKASEEGMATYFEIVHFATFLLMLKGIVDVTCYILSVV